MSTVWSSRVEEEPGLVDILNSKLNNTKILGQGYRASLADWDDRNAEVLGEPTSVLIYVSDFSKMGTARLGSIKPIHDTVFILAPTDSQATYDAFIERCIGASRRAIIIFIVDRSSDQGFRVARWWAKETNPLIRELRAGGVDLTEENRSSLPGQGRDSDWASVDVDYLLKDTNLQGVEQAAFQALAALKSGMNVIFVGPPGTGKTTLARALFMAAGADPVVHCATESWTTFETIGGYFPSGELEGEKLVFKPGIVTSSMQNNQGLVIDEINRADIDKAFGELFTLFGSNEDAMVTLPYEKDGQTIVIARQTTLENRTKDCHVIAIPNGWRLIASMNDADRASLKRFSLAFARRFAMVPLHTPPKGIYAKVLEDAYTEKFLQRMNEKNSQDKGSRLLELTASLFAGEEGLRSINLPLGPGFALAVLSQAAEEILMSKERSAHSSLLSAVTLYVCPQLQGMARKHPEFVGVLKNVITEASLEEFEELEANLASWTGGSVGR